MAFTPIGTRAVLALGTPHRLDGSIVIVTMCQVGPR